MFGLFGKKPAAQSGESLLAAVEQARSQKDYAGLARSCYQLGVHYMDQGDMERANLWLSRSSTIYSARDEIFDAVGKKLMDDCDERIGQLEEVPALRNQLPEQLEEQAEALEGIQIRMWGLMSLARLVKVAEHLGTLPGCEVLLELRRAVERILSAFEGEPLSPEDVEWFQDTGSRLYELGDDPAFFAGGAVEIPGKAPMEVFDLNGSLALLEIDGFLESFCTPEGQAETGLIPCTLLLDYYLRTRPDTKDVTKLPQVQAELARIQADFRAVRDWIPAEQAVQRVREYLELDLLA